MNKIYSSQIKWPEQSIIKVTTSDGAVISLHTPFLKFRWPMYSENREEALQILSSLSKEDLKAVLLYIYSDMPGKLSHLTVFEKCNLSNPASLQDSTFTDDMRKMMHDAESCDFKLVSEEGDFVPCHRPVIAARSKYFKSLFISNSMESVTGEWHCSRPIPIATLRFFVEYLYTGQILEPNVIQLIPLCWLVKYLKLTSEKEVEIIVISVLSRELSPENVDVFSSIAEKWNVRCVSDIVTKFKATRI